MDDFDAPNATVGAGELAPAPTVTTIVQLVVVENRVEVVADRAPIHSEQQPNLCLGQPRVTVYYEHTARAP